MKTYFIWRKNSQNQKPNTPNWILTWTFKYKLSQMSNIASLVVYLKMWMPSNEQMFVKMVFSDKYPAIWSF